MYGSDVMEDKSGRWFPEVLRDNLWMQQLQASLSGGSPNNPKEQHPLNLCQLAKDIVSQYDQLLLTNGITWRSTAFESDFRTKLLLASAAIVLLAVTSLKPILVTCVDY